MPRTQTNDIAPVVNGFPITFFALSAISTGTALMTNTTANTIAVVTNIDAVEVSGTSSSSILIGTTINSCGIFGAQTGSGNYDTFSWRGVLALRNGQGLVVLHADAGWNVVAGGFWVPDTYGFVGS